MPTDFTTDLQGEKLYIIFDGNLDYEGVGEIKGQVMASLVNSPAEIILNLKNVNYLSEDGLGLILIIAQSVWKNGKKLSYISGPSQVRHKMHVSGFDRLLNEVNQGT